MVNTVTALNLSNCRAAEKYDNQTCVKQAPIGKPIRPVVVQYSWPESRFASKTSNHMIAENNQKLSHNFFLSM